MTRIAILLFTVLAIAHTWPLARHVGTHAPDHADSILNVWILGSTAQRLVTDPLHLFDANMYYPFRATLATVDHQLSNAVLAAPLTLATGNALAAFNVFVIASFALSGVAMFVLVRALSGSAAAGLVAGTLFAFSPFRLDRLYHSHMLASFWLPLLLLAVHRFVADPRWWRLALVVALYVCQALASWYYGAMGLVAAAVVGLWMLAPRRTAWRVVAPRALAGAACSVALLIPFALPYAEVAAWHDADSNAPPEGRGESMVAGGAHIGELLQSQGHLEAVDRYSAELQNYLAPSERNRTWLGARLQRFHKSEAAFFPGILGVMLAFAGAAPLAHARGAQKRGRGVAVAVLVLAIVPASAVALAAAGQTEAFPIWLTRRLSLVTLAGLSCLVWLLWQTWRRDDGERRAVVTAYAALAVLGVLLSLGLRARAFGIDLGFAIYPATVPPFNAVKVAARFGLLFTLAVSVLAGFGVAAILRRTSGRPWRVVLVALMLIVANLELRAAPIQYIRVPRPTPIHRLLRTAPDGPVVEFPMHANIWPLYFSLYHRKPLVNGVGITDPPPYRALQTRDDLSPEMIEQLRSYFHPRYVVIDPDKYLLGEEKRLAENLKSSGADLRPLASFGHMQLFELLPGGRGPALVRWYPRFMIEDKRGVVLKGRLEGGREGASSWVRVLLDGRSIASWSADRFPQDQMAFAPFPSRPSRTTRVEVVTGYLIDPPARSEPIGTTGVMAPGDVAIAVDPMRTWVTVNNRKWRVDKGYTLAVLDPASGQIELRTFNTSWYEAASHELARFVENIPTGRVVAIASAFDVSRHLTPDAVAALRLLGFRTDLRGHFQWAHAGVGVKGAASGTAIECIDRTAVSCGVGRPADLRLNLTDLRLF